MSKKRKITMVNPCNENWGQMKSIGESERFCESCATAVIDFTKKTDDEILDIIKKSKSFCGRFRPDQLNKTYTEQTSSGFKFKLPLTGILVSFLTFSALGNKNNSIKKTIQSFKKPENLKSQYRGKSYNLIDTTQSRVITGKIYDESGIAIPGASIAIKGTTFNTISNIYGEYSITVPENIDEIINSPITLIFSFIGYTTQEIKINSKTKNVDIAIELTTSVEGGFALGGARGSRNPVVRLWWKIKGIFR